VEACENGHTATAELLIAKGADLELKDNVRLVSYAIVFSTS
jgi:ankyrin repeat protein